MIPLPECTFIFFFAPVYLYYCDGLVPEMYLTIYYRVHATFTHTKEQFRVSIYLMCMILTVREPGGTGDTAYRGARTSHKRSPKPGSNLQPSSYETNATSQQNRKCASLNVQSKTAAILTQLSSGRFHWILVEHFHLGSHR